MALSKGADASSCTSAASTSFAKSMSSMNASYRANPSPWISCMAAALPLTAITAWELLFDRFGLHRQESGDPGTLLIIGGAGGVGSILTQLARKLTALTVISTASRPETSDWCIKVGAHHVIDLTKPLRPQLD